MRPKKNVDGKSTVFAIPHTFSRKVMFDHDINQPKKKKQQDHDDTDAATQIHEIFKTRQLNMLLG